MSDDFDELAIFGSIYSVGTSCNKSVSASAPIEAKNVSDTSSSSHTPVSHVTDGERGTVVASLFGDVKLDAWSTRSQAHDSILVSGSSPFQKSFTQQPDLHVSDCLADDVRLTVNTRFMFQRLNERISALRGHMDSCMARIGQSVMTAAAGNENTVPAAVTNSGNQGDNDGENEGKIGTATMTAAVTPRFYCVCGMRTGVGCARDDGVAGGGGGSDAGGAGPVLVAGRVVVGSGTNCGGLESEAAEAFLLEDRHGCRLPLDMSQCESYALFPGQITAFKASNPSGARIVAHAQVDPLAGQLSASWVGGAAAGSFDKSIPAAPSLPPFMLPGNHSSSRGVDKENVTPAGDVGGGGSATSDLSIAIMAGPFTAANADENSFTDTVTAALRVLSGRLPDCLLVVGPLVEAPPPPSSSGAGGGGGGSGPPPAPAAASLAQRERARLSVLADWCRRTAVRLVHVPSAETSATTAGVYPTPPCTYAADPAFRHVFFGADPSTLSLDGHVVGVTGTDVIRHLSGKEVAKMPSEDKTRKRKAKELHRSAAKVPKITNWLAPTSASTTLTTSAAVNFTTSSDLPAVPSDVFALGNAVISDRMTRLCYHVLQQASYYPIYPPASEAVAVDLPMWGRAARVPRYPHLLVVPSQLKYFVKNIFGCICVNPGRMSRSTFARVRLGTKPEAQIIRC